LNDLAGLVIAPPLSFCVKLTPMGKIVPRTIEFIPDTSQLEFVKTSGTQEVYNCPWCETKYGPNDKGFYPKLYIDPDKGVGICYRCNTVVIIGDKDDPTRKLRRMAEAPPEVFEEAPLPEVFPVNHTKERLLARSPYLKDLPLNRLALGEAKIGREWVPIFPFLIDGRPYGYQLWLGREDMKYYTYEAPKVPYSPTGISTSKDYDTITLVEGVFDALGAYWLKYPNPMAILGSTVSRRELELLRSLRPKKICVYLDESPLSMVLGIKLVEELGVEVQVIKSNGEDPDERARRVHRKLEDMKASRKYLREKCRELRKEA